MYTLYHSKADGVIKITKACKGMQIVTYTDKVTFYNNNYYICLQRKPLVEKAREIKQSWVDELEKKLEKVNAIKI